MQALFMECFHEMEKKSTRTPDANIAMIMNVKDEQIFLIFARWPRKGTARSEAESNRFCWCRTDGTSLLTSEKTKEERQFVKN